MKLVRILLHLAFEKLEKLQAAKGNLIKDQNKNYFDTLSSEIQDSETPQLLIQKMDAVTLHTYR